MMAEQREADLLPEGRPKKNGSNADPFPRPTLSSAGIDKHLADLARKRNLGGAAQ